MNDEKILATAVLAVAKLREESWDPIADGYQLNIDECLVLVCKTNRVSDNMRQLLSLAFYWWNDIIIWAEGVLSE